MKDNYDFLNVKHFMSTANGGMQNKCFANGDERHARVL
jgi:hypothetical protein